MTNHFDRRSQEPRPLIVVGGGLLERGPNSVWVTKTPVAAYLHELSRIMGGCTWMTEVYSGPPLMSGLLDLELVRPIPITRGYSNIIANSLRLVLLCQHRPNVILFLPAVIALMPAIPIVRRLSHRMAVYLAGDYEMNVRGARHRNWPGWSTLLRFGYENPMRVADVVFARGRYLAGLAARLNPNTIETVPIGHMDVATYTPASAHSRGGVRRILFVGKIIWSKGVGDLLSAFRSTVHNYPGVSIMLDLVGDGPDRSSIETWAHKLDVEEHVKFHGWTESQDRLSGFFARADMLVVPSTSSQPEGVPRVIDEALIRRVPVIATMVGGIPKEFMKGEVMLVEPDSPKDLAKAIELMLFDPGLADHYLARAEQRRARWAGTGSAAQQHARALLDNPRELSPS